MPLNQPIKRVVGLIQKMKAERDAEPSKEAVMYDQVVCWCVTGKKEKPKVIAVMMLLYDMESEIHAQAAKAGREDPGQRSR